MRTPLVDETSLIVIKVGGSQITEKDSDKPQVREDVLEEMAEVLAQVYRSHPRLIVIHGAGSYGHPIASRTGIAEGIRHESQLFAFSETQELQYQLNCLVNRALRQGGVPTFPLQPSAGTILQDRRIARYEMEPLKQCLKIGLVPLLYGVPALDLGRGGAILSGDQIATYVARRLKAQLVVHLTEVGGVFTGDPHREDSSLIPQIGPQNWERVRRGLAHSAATDVTGGMLGKVEEAYALAREGIPVVISSLTDLPQALCGRGGTLLKFSNQ